jgi:predicted nicotinamide N-methyase
MILTMEAGSGSDLPAIAEMSQVAQRSPSWTVTIVDDL